MGCVDHDHNKKKWLCNGNGKIVANSKRMNYHDDEVLFRKNSIEKHKVMLCAYCSGQWWGMFINFAFI